MPAECNVVGGMHRGGQPSPLRHQGQQRRRQACTYLGKLRPGLVQIETDKGTRELRMRCESKEAVMQIIDEMQKTVNVG